MQLTENDKEEICKEIRKYTDSNVTIGQFEQFPPYGEWFVSLYFQGNFAFENRYNTESEYNFLISQVVSGIKENEIMVSVKITKSDN